MKYRLLDNFKFALLIGFIVLVLIVGMLFSVVLFSYFFNEAIGIGIAFIGFIVLAVFFFVSADDLIEWVRKKRGRRK